MPDTGTPTLDQLHVLTAVVEAGSFSAAARRLNRAQSVISYTIANLEAAARRWPCSPATATARC